MYGGVVHGSSPASLPTAGRWLENGTGMRYWWVNQNQTYRAEIDGGYIWSPKRKQNGDRNQFYEYMREVSPGDQIFSFRNRKVGAVGLAVSNCYEALQPGEFGTMGLLRWEKVGWRVDVDYTLFG